MCCLQFWNKILICKIYLYCISTMLYALSDWWEIRHYNTVLRQNFCVCLCFLPKWKCIFSNWWEVTESYITMSAWNFVFSSPWNEKWEMSWLCHSFSIGLTVFAIFIVGKIRWQLLSVHLWCSLVVLSVCSTNSPLAFRLTISDMNFKLHTYVSWYDHATQPILLTSIIDLCEVRCPVFTCNLALPSWMVSYCETFLL